jgi:hypothetical protein
MLDITWPANPDHYTPEFLMGGLCCNNIDTEATQVSHVTKRRAVEVLLLHNTGETPSIFSQHACLHAMLTISYAPEKKVKII